MTDWRRDKWPWHRISSWTAIHYFWCRIVLLD